MDSFPRLPACVSCPPQAADAQGVARAGGACDSNADDLWRVRAAPRCGAALLLSADNGRADYRSLGAGGTRTGARLNGRPDPFRPIPSPTMLVGDPSVDWHQFSRNRLVPTERGAERPQRGGHSTRGPVVESDDGTPVGRCRRRHRSTPITNTKTIVNVVPNTAVSADHRIRRCARCGHCRDRGIARSHSQDTPNRDTGHRGGEPPPGGRSSGGSPRCARPRLRPDSALCPSQVSAAEFSNPRMG